MKSEMKILHEGKAFKSKSGNWVKEVYVLITLGKMERVMVFYVEVAKGEGA